MSNPTRADSHGPKPTSTRDLDFTKRRLMALLEAEFAANRDFWPGAPVAFARAAIHRGDFVRYDSLLSTLRTYCARPSHLSIAP